MHHVPRDPIIHTGWAKREIRSLVIGTGNIPGIMMAFRAAAESSSLDYGSGLCEKPPLFVHVLLVRAVVKCLFRSPFFLALAFRFL